MRYAHLVNYVYFQPSLVTPAMHASIRRVLETRLTGEPKAIEDGFTEAARTPYEAPDRNGVAVIDIVGIIGQGIGFIDKVCGGVTDTRDVRAELMLARENARAIFLEIDSPGGMVLGTPETGDLIAEIAQEMPVVAFTGGLACSAAYWIGSQADEFYASRAAQVGSIGVYIPWVDDSAMLDEMGIKLEAIANEGAPYKGLGFNPKLTPEQRQLLQDEVNKIAADFQAAVQAGRHDSIPPEMFQGHTVYGDDAVIMGLVDGIRTRESAMQRLLEML